MIHNKQTAYSYETIDYAAIEARAHQLRAEAFDAFGMKIRSWFASLNFGFAARTAHSIP